MTILIIDNNPEDSTYIKELISHQPQKNFPVLMADTLTRGMELLSRESVALVLYALQVDAREDDDNLDILLVSYPHIPVIVLTSLGNEDKGTKAISKGCVDYLVKGALRNGGLINTIERAISSHSIQIKTEHLSLYAKANLDTLKKVLIAGQKAEIFPDTDRICKKLEPVFKDLESEEVFTLFLYNKQEDRLYLAAHNHADIRGITQPSVNAHEQSIMFQVLRMKHPLKAGDLHKTLKRSIKEQVYMNEDTFCVPLVSGHEVLGVINLNNYQGPVYAPGFLIIFTLILHYLFREIKNDFISQEIEELSLSDELTGVYNKRYLLWELNREIKRVQRYRGTLSILYINIDNFKVMNEVYGYKAGDLILKSVSYQLNKLMRTTDFVGRFKGDTFIAMLTETDKKGAYVLNRRIVKAIEQTSFDIGEKTPVQVKVKVYSAEYDFKIKNGREFIDYLKTLAEKQEQNKSTASTVKEIPALTGTQASVKEPHITHNEALKVPRDQDTEKIKEPILARDVHIYFIEPLQLISVVIDTLVKMGFESYQVDNIDKMKLLNVLDKKTRNVIFICISSRNNLPAWFEYIHKIEMLKDYTIQVGAFAYSRIEPRYSNKFLEKNIAVIKFSDIQSDTVSVLKKILLYFEAKGRRGYVRVEACDDSTAFFSIENERKVIKAKIHTLSEQFFTCYFEKNDIHHIVQGRFFSKVLLRLKGTVVQISTKIITTKKDDPRYCVMQICSALFKNKMISYTSSLKKETKDKLHRYIRQCLKENIKKKLNTVSVT